MFRFNEWANQIDEAKKAGCNCWTGYKRKPGTEPCAPGSCIKEERGLWDNIHAKQKRIKDGSGERMRKPGSKGAPTDAALKASQNEEVELDVSEGLKTIYHKIMAKRAGSKADDAADMDDEKEFRKQVDKSEYHRVKAGGKPTRINKNPDSKMLTTREEVEEQFDLIEEFVEDLSMQLDVHTDVIWEKFDSIPDEQLLEYAVDAKGHKSSTGGLTQKGRDAYNAKGANLKAPVTTPPSKLKAGSKAANRRKSFCARMSGVEGPMKKPNGEPTRKALALRKWNC